MSAPCLRNLALVGRDLLLDTLPAYVAGDIKPEPQDPSQVTFSPNIKPEEENWTGIKQSSTFQPNPWDEPLASCSYFS